MLNKFGSVNKLAKASLEDRQVSLAIDQIVEPKRANAIYFRARAISAGNQGPKGTKWNYNGNYDYFSRKELESAFRTFVGRNLFLNHDTSNPLKAVGKVLDAYPVTDPQTNEFYIECLSRIDKDLHPELAKMVENGDLNSVSMGASCGASQCSICGHIIHSDQDNKCNHLYRLGQEFEAEIDNADCGIKKGEKVPAFCINSQLTFSELSIVSVPADSSALIKTIIAEFQNKLQKIASKESGEARSIVSELEVILSLMTPIDREAIKQQICGLPTCACEKKAETGRHCDGCGALITGQIEFIDGKAFCDMCVGGKKVAEFAKNKCEYCGADCEEMGAHLCNKHKDKKSDQEYAEERAHATHADLDKSAAAYDVLIKALDITDDKTLASLDLWNAYKLAGFAAPTGSSGKDDRRDFYIALRTAINNGWIKPVEPEGIYSLTEKGLAKAEELKNALGEDVIPGKGKIPSKQDEPAEGMDMGQSKEDAKVLTPASKTAEVEIILSKLSGLELERLQDHILNKMKSKDDNTMDNLKAVVTPQVKKAEELPAAEMPAAFAPEAPKADAPMGAEHKDEIAGEKSDIKKLEEAEKLIKEVKEHEKEELKELKPEAPKAEEHAEEKKDEAAMPPFPASKKPTLTAKFYKKPFLSQSFWTVFANEKPILTASLASICGKHLSAMKAVVVSKEYGNRIIARIMSDGLEKVAGLLNVKASDEAMEHLRGKEWNAAAHEKGFNEVKKMQESAESAAEKSRAGVERPYGEPGDHLKAEAAMDKKAAEEKGFSPVLKDHSKDYEKGGAEVVKAAEENERHSASSRSAIDRPYGEPGDHLKAQAAATNKVEKKAAEEKGFSPVMKEHQKEYEKGFEEVKKEQEALQKEVNKDLPEHMRVKTSYEGGDHLVAKPGEAPKVQKKAEACMCGMPGCMGECKMAPMPGAMPSPAALPAESAKMSPDAQAFISQHVEKHRHEGMEPAQAEAAAYDEARKAGYNIPEAAHAAMQKKAGKLEPMHGESPETLSKADKLAGDVRPEGPSAAGSQNWDKNKGAFASDKVPSDEAKKAEVGKEAKLEKDEKTLEQAEADKAHPAGTAHEEMKPVDEKAAAEAIGAEGKAADISKDAKLESGEEKLCDAEKESTGSDELKPREGKGPESDEAKAKAIGTEDKAADASKKEAALSNEIEQAKARIKALESEVAAKATALAQEKVERALEAKMSKCRKLVEEMIYRDVFAIDEKLIDKYVHEGQTLLDARTSALKETVDLQLSAFMRMPDELLKVQAETISRLKKTANTGSKLRVPPHAIYDYDKDELSWMQSLPWK
jgi:hypothetical protein